MKTHSQMKIDNWCIQCSFEFYLRCIRKSYSHHWMFIKLIIFQSWNVYVIFQINWIGSIGSVCYRVAVHSNIYWRKQSTTRYSIYGYTLKIDGFFNPLKFSYIAWHKSISPLHSQFRLPTPVKFYWVLELRFFR